MRYEHTHGCNYHKLLTIGSNNTYAEETFGGTQLEGERERQRERERERERETESS